jgi:shikimate dehydrogenase
VLILGTGGTSLTANAVCRSLGADEIITVSRSEKEGCISYGNAYQKHSDASYIINCTPCGMYPKDSECPIDLDSFPSLLGVVDAIYNPLRTSLIRTAKRMGVRSEGGLYMLVSQAVRAYGYFFDKAPDTELNERVYSEILNEKQNIVLIGMPSCGKSTVGKRLCELLGTKMIDTDEMIVKKSGMPITEIFAKYGEQYFRDLESEVIREISSGVTGTVISTGGGAVLRNENLDLLRANGLLVFLDRDLSKLVATSDRPLTSDLEALRRKYNERYPIYNRVCDIRVNGNESVDEVAQIIMDRLKGGQK